MNKLLGMAVALGMLAGPALAFAQSSDAPVTRAQVRAELAQLEQAGYNVATGEDVNYPNDIQAAEAKVAAQNSAVGGVPSGGSSQAGAPMHTTHVAPSACVGPAGFCTPYFGN